MTSEPNRRIGRPPKEVTGRDGQTIAGLRCHKTTGTYYTIHEGSRLYFGKDFDRALILFREWESQRKGGTITIINPRKLDLHEVEILPDDEPVKKDADGWPVNRVLSFEGPDGTPSHQLVAWLSKNLHKIPQDLASRLSGSGKAVVKLHHHKHQIPDDLFWATFRQKMQEPGGPQLCAQKSGYPLDRLHQFKSPGKPLSLAEVWTIYDAKTFKYNRQKYDAKTQWDEFATAVGRSFLNDIKTTDLLKYKSRLDGQSLSPRTYKNRIRSIQGILNHAFAVLKDHRVIITELKQDIRSICRIPKQKEPQPKPTDVDDFKALLAVASTKWKAILLTSLNFGLHGTEMAELEKTEANLKRGEFQTNRTKTGVARVAKLWPRTVKAIREYQKTQEYRRNTSKVLFLNNDGNHYNIQRINEQIRRYRKKANLGEEVVFDGVRDLFRRAAGVRNFVATKWITGHSLGIDDIYGFRDVEETAETLAKVEKYVFGE